MLLHQFLRMVSYETPIVLFDLKGKILYNYADKRDININLYEETIFQISCGMYLEDNTKFALYIMLMKECI